MGVGELRAGDEGCPRGDSQGLSFPGTDSWSEHPEGDTGRPYMTGTEEGGASRFLHS